MTGKLKKYQQRLLAVLIVICLGLILYSGARYLMNLRDKLSDNTLQHVMDMTHQQQQAMDVLFEGDRDRLHSNVGYFSRTAETGPDEIRDRLSLFTSVNAEYSVVDLDEGWACSSRSDEIVWMDEDGLEEYRSLEGAGVRDNFIGIFTREPKFSYYETFTFSNGHHGVAQKSYDRSKFARGLSFYDGLGFGYILNEDGDILRRPVNEPEAGALYDNIFDTLAGHGYAQAHIDILRAALSARESGSAVLTSGSGGRYVYGYVPLESAEGWYLLTTVPLEKVDMKTSEIMLDTQTLLGIVVIILLLGVAVGSVVQRFNRDMAAKDQKIAYQARLFDIFFEYISSNTDDVYMMLDPVNNQIEYSTPNLERVFGLSKQEVVEKIQTFESISTTGEKINAESLRRMQPGAGTGDILVERVNPRTGAHKWFLDRTKCAEIQGDKKLICYSSDRTKEYEAQESLTEALRMARDANNAKSAFLSSISHDIRTPMNAIIGFLTLMRDEVNNPSIVMEYNRRIDAASQHLLGLINDVLDMNKIESGSTTLSIAEMNLAEIVDEVNTIIRPQSNAKNQTFDIFVYRLKHERLMGDKMRINQILINLLSNAVKYTPEHGTVQLKVEELPQKADNRSHLRFTVSDNGLGMSEAYQKVIFDPFTREETRATHEIQGTGLGMAITKNLVDLMGGTIQVTSRQGEGSTFVVELELRIQEQEDNAGFWEAHNVTKMIVADDDEMICRGIVKTMSETGVEVDYATDGQTVLRMMQEHREAGRPYDLILLDWKMPTLNGLETARLIRERYSEKIPILLLTAYDWSEIEHEATEIGINHFMPKPFFVSVFKEAIKRIMGSQNRQASVQTDIVRGKHILVVDDIEVNRMILVKILGALGATCDTAEDGRQAVDRFEASRPGAYDLILMDVQMPTMGGYEATRAIRGGAHPSARTVPIIAMTANAFADDVQEAVASGMDAHIAKPVQLDTLKTTIQQVLERKKDSIGV